MNLLYASLCKYTLLIVKLPKTNEANTFMKISLTNAWKQNKSFILFIGLMGVFKSAVADWNTVPTESMVPTILPGDQIGVNKLAYDARVPFTHITLARLGEPKHGDIVVFDSQVADKRLVKRVVGLPGDTVVMVNNQLFINGQAIVYQKNDQGNDLTEYFSTNTHSIKITNPADHSFANLPTLVVPEGKYFVLGDNRDNSADSRVIGFVPRSEIVGRASTVVMSLDHDNYFAPRTDRFFKSI